MSISPGDIAAIIAATASLVAATGSAIAVVMAVVNGRRINEVHQATNGMKEELIKATGDLKFAEGVKQGEDNPRSKQPE